MVRLWQENTLYGISPGAGLCATLTHPALPESSAGLSFGLAFPTDSTYAGRGLVSLSTTSLKRSASSALSIRLTVSWDVACGALAAISNRSVLSQFGPPTILLV